jgi:hypothetical protein
VIFILGVPFQVALSIPSPPASFLSSAGFPFQSLTRAFRTELGNILSGYTILINDAFKMEKLHFVESTLCEMTIGK